MCCFGQKRQTNDGRCPGTKVSIMTLAGFELPQITAWDPGVSGEGSLDPFLRRLRGLESLLEPAAKRTRGKFSSLNLPNFSANAIMGPISICPAAKTYRGPDDISQWKGLS